jgi:hypothetical protein
MLMSGWLAGLSSRLRWSERVQAARVSSVRRRKGVKQFNPVAADLLEERTLLSGTELVLASGRTPKASLPTAYSPASDLTVAPSQVTVTITSDLVLIQDAALSQGGRNLNQDARIAVIGIDSVPTATSLPTALTAPNAGADTTIAALMNGSTNVSGKVAIIGFRGTTLLVDASGPGVTTVTNASGAVVAAILDTPSPQTLARALQVNLGVDNDFRLPAGLSASAFQSNGMGDGNKTVVLSNLQIRGAVEVATGLGEDSIGFEDVVVFNDPGLPLRPSQMPNAPLIDGVRGAVEISTGSEGAGEGDVLYFAGEFGALGDVRINTEGGDDGVFFDGLTQLRGGTQTESHFVEGDLLIDLAAGDDTLSVDFMEVTGRTLVQGNAGNDTILVGGNSILTGSALISGGSGNDIISVENVTANGSSAGPTGAPVGLVISGNLGDDHVSVGILLPAIQKVQISGGQGNDTAQVSDPSVLISRTGYSEGTENQGMVIVPSTVAANLAKTRSFFTAILVPQSSDDTGTTAEDTTLSVPATTGLLANDIPKSLIGEALAGTSLVGQRASLVQNTPRGTTTVNADGSYTFAPAVNDNNIRGGAPFVFRYVLDNGVRFANSTSNVTVNVTQVNDTPVVAPLAQPFVAPSTNEDTRLPFTGAAAVAVSDVEADFQGTGMPTPPLGEDQTPSIADRGQVQVQITVNNGTITNAAGDLTAPAGVTIAGGALNSTSVTLKGTSANVNAALLTLGYTPTLNLNSVNAVTPTTATFVVTDLGNAPVPVSGPNLTATFVQTITVNPVNDAPTVAQGSAAPATSGTATTLEDTALPLTGANAFTLADVDVNEAQIPANANTGLLSVVVTAANGTITGGGPLPGGVTVTAGAVGTATVTLQGTPANLNTALASLSFTPTANFNSNNGAATLTLAVNDLGNSPAPALMANFALNITVTPVNDAPAGTDVTLTTLEDTPLVFAAANFGFTDPNDVPPNALARVRITTLPLVGALTLNANPVAAGDFVTVAQIAGGQFIYTSPQNQNGLALTTFTFQVEDDGGVLNGGVNLDASANTITINVTPVNDAPTVTVNGTVVAAPLAPTTTEGSVGAVSVFGVGAVIALVDPDVNEAQVPANPNAGMMSVSFPLATANGGSLTSSAPGPVTVTVAMGIVTLQGTPADLATAMGSLTYVAPASDFNGTDSFTITVSDLGNSPTPALTTVLTVNAVVIPVNDAPVGADSTVNALEGDGTPATGYVFLASDFGFSDPNDTPPNNLLSVTITTLPLVGTLTLSGNPVTANDVIPVASIIAGNLVYAPPADANGTALATFTFQVQDDGGTANGGVDLDATPRTMTIDVTAVNDAPSFTLDSPSLAFTQSASPQVITQTTFARSISAGPANESMQMLTFDVTNDNNALFDVQPTIDVVTGDLTFTIAANAVGTATVTVTLMDDGGTANMGSDSLTLTFTIMIT